MVSYRKYDHRIVKLNYLTSQQVYCKVIHLRRFFKIFLDYILRKLLDLNHDFVFTFVNKYSRSHKDIKMTYVYYANDLSVLTDILKDA